MSIHDVVRRGAEGVRAALPVKAGRSIAVAGVVALHSVAALLLWAPRRVHVVPEDPVLVSVALAAAVSSPPQSRPLPAPVRIVAQPVMAALPEIIWQPELSESAPTATTDVPKATPPTAAVEPDLTVSCPVRVPPRYPPEARRRRDQGTVVLRVQIDETGQIDQVSVVQSAGSRDLDEAGIAAVRQWHCQPAMRDGQRLPAVALQSLEFVLNRR